jgi:hypothetical protein
LKFVIVVDPSLEVDLVSLLEILLLK